MLARASPTIRIYPRLGNHVDMDKKEIPELQTLLQEVEKKYGRPLECTNDFRVLAALMEYECKEIVSVSTLKRLWGYVSQQTTPREGTLDVLSRFVGYKSFEDFRLSQFGKLDDVSGYLDASFLSARDVPVGGKVSIGWAPNRLLSISKIGAQEWEITRSSNSKLMTGDRFEAACFFKGLPLFLPYVTRNGERLPSYIAGKQKGLNKVALEKVVE